MENKDKVSVLEQKLETQTAALEETKKQLGQALEECKHFENKFNTIQHDLGKRINKRAEKLEEINEQLTLELNERRMITESLQESEQQFRTLVDNIPGAIYRCKVDEEWTMEFLSDAIQEISGYSAFDFIENRERSYRSIIHHDDIEKYEKAILEGMDPLKSFFIEYRIFNAEGKTRWITEKGQCVYSVDGQPLWLDGAIFDESDRKFAEEALQKANEKLKRQATLDGLTQIGNRRKFDEYLDEEWRRMKREHGVLSLILCDIDYFKLYNDGYGHQAGDKCLQVVAQLIDSVFRRPADVVARYGGEEFAIILPNTDARGAVYMAELIKKEMLRVNIAHEYSKVSQSVTLSLGVSSVVPNHFISKEIFINKADKALYKAKENGRNKVVCCSDVDKITIKQKFQRQAPFLA